MGKNRHSKDRLFITQTEHKYLYGGKKAEIRRAYKRLPFNCCAITLRPFSNPVCTREGHLFDLEAIVPFVKQNQINPVTGAPLALKDLIQLRFSKNSDGEFFCPVTYKVFTDSSKIAAVAATGNVYAFEAVEELNIKAKNWTDLLTGAKFKRKDIIILQDPLDYSSREIENFEHLRRARASDGKPGADGSAAKNIRTNAATDRILQELEAKRTEQRQIAEKVKRGDDDVSDKDKIVASLTHNASSDAPLHGEKSANNGAKLQYSRFTDGEASSSFTSSARAPVTRSKDLVITEQEQLEERWQTVRRMKKKGLVRLVTSLGDVNVEVHCDFVPQTADNFMSLCEAGYYDSVLFHRVIPGFMAQGGDPTGTGRGGESVWKKPFRDEIDSRLSHNARGVLSMANAGPGTNRSQFFITFKACEHLDKKHAVFGRVVGGMEVLDAIEKVETSAKDDRPVEDVRISSVQVFVNPFKEYEEAKANGEDVLLLQKAKRAEEARPRVRGTVVKVGGEWVAYEDVGDADLAAIPSSVTTKEEQVGKYLKAGGESKTSSSRASGAKKRPMDAGSDRAGWEASVPAAIEGKKKQKTVEKSKAGGFGSFAGW